MAAKPLGEGIARRRFIARWIGILALATAFAAGLARTEWGRSIENIYFDYWHVIKGVRYQPQHTVFVEMDDATLVALKDDPLAFWAPYFGKAMDTLTAAGVKAVGLDFIYQVSAEGWLRKLNLPDSEISRNYDTPLRAALASGNKILITHLVTLPDGELELLTPPQDQLLLLPGQLHDLGIANLYPDDDKHVRHFYPVLIPDPGFPGIGFGMQLALRGAGQDPGGTAWRIGGLEFKRERKLETIGYAGPPGTIPTLSMKDLLQPDALANPKVQAAKGKIAIIAANNAGTSDRHFTPYSRGKNADQMAGGEIHCNIVETILSGRFPKALSLPLELGYVGLVLALAAWFFLRFSPAWSGGLVVLICVLVAVPAYFAFQHDWVLPVAELQFGTVGAFLMTLGLRLTGEERERSRMRQVFGRYVSDEVVNVLLAEGHRPDLGGEALNVTVLFSDIRGFTTISEKLTAHEVVEMLNAYFTIACEPILAQGGTVDKYIGDAVMAVFGSPVRYPDHARRAVKAAVGMSAAAHEFKQWMLSRFPDRGLPEFGIGVGLHTGEAVIGDIGTPKRKEFTAIGDTVNAASRLEGATKELGCVIAASEATVTAAGAGVKTGKFEEIKVKGRAGAIRVYEVTGLEEA
ncbi:MAG: adenylate/guanylate cyclase domain-containing protein [Burkholderiales bacterium]